MILGFTKIYFYLRYVGKGSVAGLMGNPIAYKGTINMAQADSLTDTGIYFINGTSSSNALTNDGTLVMFKGHNYTQTFYSSSNPIAAYIRRRVGTTGDWTPWQRIDNFGFNSLAELSAGIDSARPANNSKSFSVSDSVEVDTGITKMGLYRWGFDKLEYANPMYFIVTANHGVTVLNQTWFSGNVTFRMGDGKLYFTYGAKATVYLTYLG